MTGPHPKSSPWLTVQPTGEDHPALRLVCFPPAGGGSAAYAAALGSPALTWVEFHTVEMPGRASRIEDPPAASVEVVVTEVAEAIAATVATGQMPYALLGQCMGGVLAYEVGVRLDKMGVRPPVRIFVAGANGPSYAIPDVDDPLAYLRNTGGAPQELFNSPELLEIVLEVLRADLGIMRDHQSTCTVVSAPITVLTGTEDVMLDQSGVQTWEGLSAAGVTFQGLAGKHFFLDPYYEMLLSQLRAELRS